MRAPLFLVVVVLTGAFAPAPARAWEAKAAKVAERLSRPRTPAAARQWRKPGWARKIHAPEDRVFWTEAHGGKTFVFGVGLARGVDNPGLRATAAADRARASLLEGKEGALLEGSEILDWYLDRRGDMYALAVLTR
ncbi:MAG: hypothetical protein HYX59_09630 [Elusimicrobia bacterium]|nr:hypothetical protein [Elusimicrobiota bacterium]